MAVSLPTAADVRKVREQAAKTATERAEVARTPLLAVLGAGDAAVAAVTKAVSTARTRATAQAEDVQQRVTDLPAKLGPAELRKIVAEFGAELRARAEQRYTGLAERGELAWGRLLERPQVKQALSTFESYTDKLDAQVDALVEDASEAAEKALSTVTTQTRSTGERVARAAQRLTGQAAEKVTEVSREAGEAVAAKGSEVAESITTAGADVAHEARSVSRKAANRTAPKPAARKPQARRSAPAGDTPSAG